MKVSKKPLLSIILPARNEAALLPNVLPDIYKYCRKLSISFEILVILNGCTDNSHQIVKNIKYPNIKVYNSDPGYGKALRKGLEKSKGVYVAIYNVDFYDNKLLDLAKIDLYGKDLIIGSKMAPWSQDYRSLIRKTVSYLYNLYLKIFYGFSGSDTHGIKILRSEVVKKILPLCHTDSGIFDTEFVIKTQRQGYKLADFPVVVKEIRPPRFKSRLTQTPRDLVKLHRSLTDENDKSLFYDTLVDTWENVINNNETNKRLKVVFEKLLKSETFKNRQFLEVGCGLGYFISQAKQLGADIHGIDIGKRLVEKSQSRAPGKYRVGSAINLPYKNNSFDIIICTEVIEHTPDPQKAVQEIIRVLKPGGKAVITTPNKLFKPLFDVLSLLRLRPYQGVENWLSVSQLKSTILAHKGVILKEYHFNFFYPNDFLDKLENIYPFSLFTINQGYKLTK